VGHAGSDEQPREIELTAGESDKGGKSAWQWWAIGAGGAAVVAGGILAAVLLINGGNDLGDQALVSVIVE